MAPFLEESEESREEIHFELVRKKMLMMMTIRWARESWKEEDLVGSREACGARVGKMINCSKQ